MDRKTLADSNSAAAIFWYARVGGGGEYIYIPVNSAGHIDVWSS